MAMDSEGVERSPDAQPASELRPPARHAPSDRTCDELISLLAHELRGPLATLTGYSQLLVKKGMPADIEEKAARSVLDQAKRLNVMIDNLLQASRLSAGRLRVTLQPGDLRILVKQVVEQQQQSSLHNKLVVDVPDQPLNALFDPDLLALALGNMIQNATKFSPRDSEVLVFLRRNGNRGIVSVLDSGQGIGAQDIAQVFEPYRTERGGMGVGLFVAKGIVETHDGEIGINSMPGAGTTVWFGVPLQV